mmetsp:Transcript_51691/g.126092  ORF Transcript_51691/g.126092 Transcript_51691/m.126092 type:complete len:222 (-) Transcript_51691:267-932(-)
MASRCGLGTGMCTGSKPTTSCARTTRVPLSTAPHTCPLGTSPPPSASILTWRMKGSAMCVGVRVLLSIGLSSRSSGKTGRQDLSLLVEVRAPISGLTCVRGLHWLACTEALQGTCTTWACMRFLPRQRRHQSSSKLRQSSSKLRLWQRLARQRHLWSRRRSSSCGCSSWCGTFSLTSRRKNLRSIRTALLQRPSRWQEIGSLPTGTVLLCQLPQHNRYLST